jgi:hypothetical protein
LKRLLISYNFVWTSFIQVPNDYKIFIVKMCRALKLLGIVKIGYVSQLFSIVVVKLRKHKIKADTP